MQTKECRKCRQELTLDNFTRSNIGKYGVNSTCKECQRQKTSKSTLINKKPLQSKINEGKVRGVSRETKQKVLLRDKGACVICGIKYNLSNVPHHTYFGGRKKYDGNDNTEKNLVTICEDCHRHIHHGADGKNEEYRKICEDYITNLYG